MINKLRGILMKLAYNSNIDIIEDNLSPSNIGARKVKSSRDHLFVINSVIQDVIRSKKKQPVDVVFYDVRQCFDSLWVSKTLLDLYRNGIQDNTLNLLFEASKQAKISIKTPVGMSEESLIKEIIMQGETFSSIMCTSTMDRISQECTLKPYKYREAVDIPKLGFVDDLVDIQPCGKETEEMNIFTNNQMNNRKLQCCIDKCHRMHIGKYETCHDI